MELWEYNACMRGMRERRKQAAADCIVTGYYCAYYLCGGKQAKPPKVLIESICAEPQSRAEGMEMIRKIKEMDRRRNSYAAGTNCNAERVE